MAEEGGEKGKIIVEVVKERGEQRKERLIVFLRPF